jgi:ferredoxin-fold anticodon binding domain-containing protein
MRDTLQAFLGKTLRIYTVSGGESYLGTLEDVKDDHVVITGHFKKDKIYLSIGAIESFKEEIANDA